MGRAITAGRVGRRFWFAALAAAAAILQADGKTWTGAVDDSWQNDGNWSNPADSNVWLDNLPDGRAPTPRLDADFCAPTYMFHRATNLVVDLNGHMLGAKTIFALGYTGGGARPACLIRNGKMGRKNEAGEHERQEIELTNNKYDSYERGTYAFSGVEFIDCNFHRGSIARIDIAPMTACFTNCVMGMGGRRQVAGLAGTRVELVDTVATNGVFVFPLSAGEALPEGTERGLLKNSRLTFSWQDDVVFDGVKFEGSTVCADNMGKAGAVDRVHLRAVDAVDSFFAVSNSAAIYSGVFIGTRANSRVRIRNSRINAHNSFVGLFSNSSGGETTGGSHIEISDSELRVTANGEGQTHTSFRFFDSGNFPTGCKLTTDNVKFYSNVANGSVPVYMGRATNINWTIRGPTVMKPDPENNDASGGRCYVEHLGGVNTIEFDLGKKGWDGAGLEFDFPLEYNVTEETGFKLRLKIDRWLHYTGGEACLVKFGEAAANGGKMTRQLKNSFDETALPAGVTLELRNGDKELWLKAPRAPKGTLIMVM